MSVPTHGSSCQTLVYQTDCWYCGRAIHVLQCTCGSALLLDSVGWPWPKHDCGGIGGSGLSGWAAVDALRAMGVPIDSSIMKRAFPPPATGARKLKIDSPEAIKPIHPGSGEQISLLAVIRELFVQTNRTERLKRLGAIGSKLARLPKGSLWQTTLVVNNQSPNLSYTCILPQRAGVPRDSMHKMMFAQLEGRTVGEDAFWLVTDMRLL